MNDKKQLRVMGKSHFYSNDEVVLNVEMKNIKNMKVKVFEVNTEKYLRTKNNQDYNSIKVDFLIPSEEYSYSFEKPSSLVHVQ